LLSIIEGRVLGCLLEKERTTPDQYPLTLNALVSACNQSTSRDPVMALDEHEVQAALTSLKAAGLLRFVHPSHGRSVTRYRHVADEAWQLEAPTAAVLAVLLLRGLQTPSELRARSERAHAFETTAEVEAALHELANTEKVRRQERLPGAKEPRWQQLLAEEAERTAPPALSGAAVSGSVADRVAQLEARVAKLEAALADLL
jgi:uncharacterized protein